MSVRTRASQTVLLFSLFTVVAGFAFSQQYDPKLFNEMRWRSIGPYRGGRTKSAAGVPQQPNVFYIGVCNGGVWKTNDFGRSWKPIFDEQPTGSIGSIAVAPSDPSIVYVGSGEGLQRPDLSTGDGVYKSSDAGKTWVHLGLRDGQQIPKIAIDPKNPNRIFVAVLGHPYGPNAERGIFRSTDGGLTFEKVLYKDENTGGYDLEIDPSNPETVYATLWEARQGPWENASWTGTNGGIFKSTDGGSNWRPLTNGLERVVQADIAVAPSNPKRIYASVTGSPGGIYRSDDAGETWFRATSDPRPAGRIGGGDQSVPVVNPKNADILWVASTVTWKSVDGGKTWTGFRGAPGGDDYQSIWVNPDNPDIILNVADQGAIITVNGGETWSSWYNQPTAQLYHVAADNSFPYRVCSGQQESGSACVPSRGRDGQITFRDWSPVGVDEYGYAAPDPLDSDFVYGGRSVTRFDRRTGQVQTVGPRAPAGEQIRTLRTAPVVFSPVDPHILFFAANRLWKTLNGGMSWTAISGDLSRPNWEVPATVGKYRDSESAKPSQRGVIYTVAPSYKDVNVIWAGTDDGLVYVTADGGAHWSEVTPKELVPWAKVSLIDAGRFDPQTAYAAVNTIRLDDIHPHIYRTHDGGKIWKHITAGIPDGGTINAVREDPIRKGMLFAGTEREVYVSFDDGENWQSLRLNMPASSVRDLIVKDDDLIAATHGRGFWILDDITPLRQLDTKTAAAGVFLFRPQTALRVRNNLNTDTPLPPDEPGGQNPPDGAIIDYYLKTSASGPVTLEILDSGGRTIRRYSSNDPLETPNAATAPVPLYWYRPPKGLASSAGMHRFVWDLHYQPLPSSGGRGAGLPMQAIAHDTAPAPNSPWVAPGEYAVRLTVDGIAFTQPMNVRMDPRVKATEAELKEQGNLSLELYNGVLYAQAAVQDLRALRARLRSLQEKARGGTAEKDLADFDAKASALEGTAGGSGGRGAGAAPGRDALSNIGGSLSSLMSLLQEADAGPTTQQAAAVQDRLKSLEALKSRWTALRTTELSALNAQLKTAGLPEINP
jgi:photosystem II stability/assembly factor-like uncharacterized protein